MAKIAFLGLGNMGQGMAMRLIEAGHDLCLYNRTRARAEVFTAKGARIADHPRIAVEDVEAVFVMVGDDAASQAVWLGDDGILAGNLAPNAFAIECSTLSHKCVLQLAEATQSAGLRYIDCPVTGLPVSAVQGELTLLVGAEGNVLDAAKPLLEPLSREIVHFGAIGAGTAYKLMINLLGSIQIASLAEGLVLAEKAGLDLRQVMAALETGQAASPQVVRNGRMMAELDPELVNFTARLRVKDTAYAVEFAESLDFSFEHGKIALKLFERLAGSGDGSDAEFKLFDLLRSDD